MTEVERLKFLELLGLAPDGWRIEFGVFRGDTLALMAEDGQPTMGVDSFEGMPEPGADDITPDGENPYPKGRLRASMDEAQRAAPTAYLLKAWVPQVLDVTHAPPNGFAFAHVDLDHYASTLVTLNWLWPRMKTGGIIVCDDWFADRDYLAAKAIAEFGCEFRFPEACGRKAWWVL